MALRSRAISEKRKEFFEETIKVYEETINLATYLREEKIVAVVNFNLAVTYQEYSKISEKVANCKKAVETFEAAINSFRKIRMQSLTILSEHYLRETKRLCDNN